MARLTIDGIEIEVPEGATVLDAARAAGVAIPTLCYLAEIGPLTSCMLCVVNDRATGRLVPACSARAVDGMAIETNTEAVRSARREILRLLLVEHVGDCEGPCARTCPAALDIPRLLRRIVADDLDEAMRIAKRDLVFPATLGYWCPAPCEKACRRGAYDAPVAIRAAHRAVGERVARDGGPRFDPGPPTGKAVAIVGAGLAGFAAAWECRRMGHACRIYDSNTSPLDRLLALNDGRAPRDIVESEIRSVLDMGIEFVPNCERLPDEFDAAIVACDIDMPEDARLFRAHQESMPARAVAYGKTAAEHVDAFLRDSAGPRTERRFNSRIGKLHAEELEAYASERMSADTPREEAARCLHCDCLKPVSCKLRRYAEEYGVTHQSLARAQRPRIEPVERFEDVLFEPGKCVRCGLCVAIAQTESEDLGLAFSGRGLDTRVRTPLGMPLARGLGKAAARCVAACPTGALAYRNREETP